MAHSDNVVFLGRRLSCRWFSADKATEAASLQAKNQQFAASLQGMSPDQLMALAQLLDPSVGAVASVQALPNMNIAPAPVAQQGMQPQQQAEAPPTPAWSSLVSSWLNDYVSMINTKSATCMGRAGEGAALQGRSTTSVIAEL